MRLMVLTIRMITTAVSSHLEFIKQLNDFATYCVRADRLLGVTLTVVSNRI